MRLWKRFAEAGYNLRMPSPTAQFFREMLDAADSHHATIEALNAAEGESAPTRVECSAIQRVQKSLRQLMTTLKAEVADLG